MEILLPSTTLLLSAFFAASYVCSLYIFPAGRLRFNNERVEVGRNAERARALNERWRNDPATIQARLSGVALSTVFSCLIVYAVVTKTGSWKVSYSPFLSFLLNALQWGDLESVSHTMRLLGIVYSNIPISAWYLAPLLYTGSLYIQMLDRELPFQQNWSLQGSLVPIFKSWLGFRNIIAVRLIQCLNASVIPDI
jgi:prenyl protein peptidase